MSINLERNVQILSEHYVKRFKHLIDTNRKKDAYSIGQELSLIHNSEPTRPY